MDEGAGEPAAEPDERLQLALLHLGAAGRRRPRRRRAVAPRHAGVAGGVRRRRRRSGDDGSSAAGKRRRGPEDRPDDAQPGVRATIQSKEEGTF